MDRKAAAGTLREIARLLEVAGENPYRVRAFAAAARVVEAVSGDLAELVASGAITELRGIGKGTAAVLEELADGGPPRVLVEARQRVPPGVREMLTLPGLGPKKVRTLWQDLGVESLGELEYACRENRLLDLKGFGPASQTATLEAVSFRHRARDRRLVHEAWEEFETLRRRLEGRPGVVTVEPAGELRRGSETVGELAAVVRVDGTVSVAEIVRAVGSAATEGDGQWLSSPEEGLPVRLWFGRPDAGGAVAVRATGDDEFVAALAERAAGLGTTLNDRGLCRDETVIAAADETAVFAALGLQWIPPELRQGSRWLAASARGALPDLVGLDDLRGAFHNHTSDSDGANTLEEMAAAAADRGWSYLGVADHSPAAFYANGVDAERLQAQWRRADAWNRAHRELRVVKGLEADILSDGRLDIPEECRGGLEMVVASVHSSFRLAEEVQTRRLVAAVRDPACRVLGHPTGRLLLARPGYAVDLEQVLDACAESGVAVEINASPYRLDVDWRWARRAVEKSVKLAINPDAHWMDGLDDVRWGVMVARRAGATAADIVNCNDIEDFLSH